VLFGGAQGMKNRNAKNLNLMPRKRGIIKQSTRIKRREMWLLNVRYTAIKLVGLISSSTRLQQLIA
jgi:hypothetical protein